MERYNEVIIIELFQMEKMRRGRNPSLFEWMHGIFAFLSKSKRKGVKHGVTRRLLGAGDGI
ncbi:hypothetical protein CULT_1350010 [[Clostridium] ultunense Esp]|nr:hypothetical protein CULT_1350010 [[Clostridium] ultunense Esp]